MVVSAHPSRMPTTMELPEAQTSTPSDPVSQLAVGVADMARALFAADSVEATLARIVELAVATVEGCDYAGIFLLEGREVTTPVCTAPIVAAVDALQHRFGSGPCLDAIAQGLTFYAEDLDDDARWPEFGGEAVTAGVRSVLAVPLTANDTHGALNLYAHYPAAFGVVDRGKGVMLAALSSVALAGAQTHEVEQRRTDSLRAALATREVIGLAQGILVERERVRPDQAFDILRRASQHLNHKLRDVAQELVDTGERPETAAPPTDQEG
ncbi:MAG: ANTAR domain-containing protein [Acidimicrobiales bacterium]